MRVQYSVNDFTLYVVQGGNPECVDARLGIFGVNVTHFSAGIKFQVGEVGLEDDVLFGWMAHVDFFR